MTIAAGFVVRDGVLLCADTLYTPGGAKLPGAKIVASEIPCGKVIFAFAGNADFAQATIQKCLGSLRRKTPEQLATNAAIAAIVEKVLDSEYRRLVYNRPDRDQGTHDFRLLLACWNSSEEMASLYTSYETSIKACEEYDCFGAGYYLGNYLIRPMFHPTMSTEEAQIIATYAVARAKEYVEGCGDRTNIVTLKHDGTINGISWTETEPLERALKGFDARVRVLLFGLLTQTDMNFYRALQLFNDTVGDIRVQLGLDDKGRFRQIQQMQSLFTNLEVQSTPESTTPDPQFPPASQE